MAEEQDITMQVDTRILLAIQNTLGKVEEAVTTVKDDISELKHNAQQQAQNIEGLYEKAKSRQDAIRDDLQHQIDDIKERLNKVETKKEKTLLKWYDRLVDKLIWFIIIAALIVIFRFVGIPAELIKLLH